MQAEPLEEFVGEAAIRLLENLAVSPKRTRTAMVEAAERAIQDDKRQLNELHDMWINNGTDKCRTRQPTDPIRLTACRGTQSARRDEPSNRYEHAPTALLGRFRRGRRRPDHPGCSGREMDYRRTRAEPVT